MKKFLFVLKIIGWVILGLVGLAATLFLAIGPIVYVCLDDSVKENLPSFLNTLCWIMIIKS